MLCSSTRLPYASENSQSQRRRRASKRWDHALLEAAKGLEAFSLPKLIAEYTAKVKHFRAVGSQHALNGTELDEMQFFQKIGIPDVKFKPAYNPYTEPSMEIFGYHPLLKKTVELGNSGVFRPEMLLPMGLPEDVTVIAWGIGLERTAARMYSIRGIKELFSHEQDSAETRKKGLCWLTRAEEKEMEGHEQR